MVRVWTAWMLLTACAEVPPAAPVAEEPRKETVVRVKGDLAPGRVLVASDLDVVDAEPIAVETRPAEQVFTEVDEAVGRTVAEAILAGEVLRAERLAPPSRRAGLSLLVPPDKRAAMIAIPKSQGVDLRPGDQAHVYFDLLGAPRRRVIKLSEPVSVLAVQTEGEEVYVALAVTAAHAEGLAGARPESLRLMQVPMTYEPVPGSPTGGVPCARLLPGEPIQDARLADPSEGRCLEYGLAPGHVLVHVETPEGPVPTDGGPLQARFEAVNGPAVVEGLKLVYRSGSTISLDAPAESAVLFAGATSRIRLEPQPN